jgi:tetratricopeptide (TPR) repeat protein
VSKKEKHIALAEQNLAEDNINAAIKGYMKAAHEDPEDPVTAEKLGGLLLGQGKKDDAMLWYAKAGPIYLRSENYEKSAIVYAALVKLDSEDGSYYEALGDTHKALGQTDEAVECYRKGARAHKVTKAEVQQLRCIKKILDEDENNVRGRIQLVEAYSNAALLDEAARLMDLLGQDLAKKKQWSLYTIVMERLLHFRNDGLPTLHKLVDGYLKGEQPSLALVHLKKCYELEPDNLTTLTFLAGAFNQLGQIAKANAVLKKKAALYQSQSMTAEYQEVLRQILVLNPDDQHVQRLLDGTPEGGGMTSNTDMEIASVPDAEIDALIAEIQRAEDDGEFDVGALLSEVPDDSAPPVNFQAPTQNLERGVPMMVGDDPQLIPTLIQQSVITSITQEPEPPHQDGGWKTFGSSDEIDQLIEIFEQEMADEDAGLGHPSHGVNEGPGVVPEEANVALEQEVQPEPEIAAESEPEVVVEAEPEVVAEAEPEVVAETTQKPIKIIPEDNVDEVTSALHQFEDVSSIVGEEGEPDDPPASPIKSQPEAANEPIEGLFDELNEFDFYLENGLMDEAAELLSDLEQRFPDRPEIVERREQMSA